MSTQETNAMSLLAKQRKQIAIDVRNHKVDWHLLPNHWKEDAAIATAAFRRGPPLRHSVVLWKELPARLRDSAAQYPEMVLAALESYALQDWHADVPEPLRTQHPDIVLYGVRQGLVRADDHYNDHSNNTTGCLSRGMLRTAVEQGMAWRKLPEVLRNDIDFAREISCFRNDATARFVLEQFPALRRDRAYWIERVFAGQNSLINLKSLIQNFAPSHFLWDPEYMVAACRQDGKVLTLVHGTNLKDDRDFYESVLLSNPSALKYTSYETQALYPDLVMQTFKSLVSKFAVWGWNDITSLAAAINPIIWKDEAAVFLWFELGLPFVTELGLPTHWTENKQIFLLIAQRCQECWRLRSFRNAHEDIRNDTEFMLQVLEFDAALYEAASISVQQNHEAAVLGFAEDTHKKWLDRRYMFISNPDDTSRKQPREIVLEWLLSFHARVLDWLQAYEKTFVQTVLRGASLENSNSTLSILNQGADTSRVYMKLIAEFLGIPVGSRLVRLWKVDRYVKNAITAIDPFEVSESRANGGRESVFSESGTNEGMESDEDGDY